MGLVIKRASLERDYKSQPLADCGINFHTTYEYSGIHLRAPHIPPPAQLCTADFHFLQVVTLRTNARLRHCILGEAAGEERCTLVMKKPAPAVADLAG